MKKAILFILLGLGTAKAQFIENYSFEGQTFAPGIPPPGWFPCNDESTPDSQPGFFGVYNKASDGERFLGIVTRGKRKLSPHKSFTTEAINTKLLRPLRNGHCYNIKVDLAYATTYMDSDSVPDSPIKLRCFGGNSECDKRELLFESEVIRNTDWETFYYSFSIEEQGLEYIILEATCDSSEIYEGNILVDNFVLEDFHEDKKQIKLDTIVSIGNQVELTASPGGLYSWYNGILSCTDCQTTVATVNHNQSVFVSLDYGDGCKYNEEFIIKVHDCDTIYPDSIILKADTYIAMGTELILQASESPSYNWYGDPDHYRTNSRTTEDLSCTQCQNPKFTIMHEQVFMVDLIGEFNCPYTEKYPVYVANCEILVPIRTRVRLDTTIGNVSEIQLLASESKSYVWELNNSLSCLDCRNPIANVSETERFQVSITGEYGCTITEVFLVRYSKELEELSIPNVLTPNGDGKNDVLIINGLPAKTSLQIFDRNGRVVYSNNNYDNTWRGTYGDGSVLKQDTYWFVLKNKYYKTQKGFIYIKLDK